MYKIMLQQDTLRNSLHLVSTSVLVIYWLKT